MRRHENTFTPDTCPAPGCRIVFDFDRDLPQDQWESSYQLIRIEHKCVAHAALTDRAVYDQAWFRDNRLKNAALSAISRLAPTLVQTVDLHDEDMAAVLAGTITARAVRPVGTMETRLKRTVDVGWTFDASRTLRLDILDLTSPMTRAEKTSLRNALRADVGDSGIEID